jgi:hypothetical protein
MRTMLVCNDVPVGPFFDKGPADIVGRGTRRRGSFGNFIFVAGFVLAIDGGDPLPQARELFLHIQHALRFFFASITISGRARLR